VHFSAAGGEVVVRVTGGSHPGIEVFDDGVGIPADELPYVFDRFFRGRYARQQATPGMGLGLTIARSMVEAQHGTVTATSTVDVGTTVRITVPSG
jgi:signal transduction histidine kinase